MTPWQLISLTRRPERAEFEWNAATIGGKALSLSRMSRLGLPVPEAWVIPIAACEEYFECGGCIPNEFLDEVWRKTTLEGANSVAVRSGAEASLPGLLKTVLQIQTREGLEQAIRDVFDSWQSDTAISFRQTQRLEHLRGTAVVLQKMIPTDVAGVLFSRDPLDCLSESMVIEAVPGSGDQLVSGEESGTRWVIPRSSDPTDSLDNDIRPLLTRPQIQTLRTFALQIETDFACPVDIEWGLHSGQFWLFQARPIVVNSSSSPPVPDDLIRREQMRLGQLAQMGCPIWVEHSLGESLPHPTPLSWSIWREFMCGAGGYGQLFRLLGYAPSRRACQQGFLQLVAGRIYASPDLQPDIYGVDFPYGYSREELRQNPTLFDQGPNLLDLDRVGPWFLLRSPWILWSMWRASQRIQKLIPTAVERFENVSIPEYRAWMTREESRSLAGLCSAELITLFLERKRQLLERFAPWLMLPGTLGAAALSLLQESITAASTREHADEYCRQLLASLRVPVLEELSQGLQGWGQERTQAFLDRFGHRSAEELELSQPTWRESPESIPRIDNRPISGNEVVPPRFQPPLETGSVSSRQRIVSLERQARNLLSCREVGKDEMLKGYALLRQTCRALEGTTGLGRNLYFLTCDELARYPAIPELNQLEVRRSELNHWRQISPPPVIDESTTFASGPGDSTRQSTLRGEMISPGFATGTAWLIDQHVGVTVPTNSIVILRRLTPQRMAGLSRARGVVVNHASLLSHGAVLARQLGIPVLALADATQRLKTGDVLTFEHGTLTIREKTSANPSHDNPSAADSATP